MNVAIYCRLSDEDRDKLNKNDDSGSIQNQKAMLIKYASNNGWAIHDIYSDDDYAGSDRNRPEFNRLIRDAKARKFGIVLCKTQSRFTREIELVEKYIHGLFPRLGIRFISIVDNADTDNRGNKKARQINGLVNEWFLEELSENIKAVKTHQRYNGVHIGSFAPYGYKKDPELKGHLIVDPEAAAIVHEVFTLFANGMGKQGIARVLNERGVPNPTEYKRQHGMVRNKDGNNSGLWQYFTVSDMLINQVYIGNLVQGKTAVLNYKTQEKLVIPKEQWITVEGTHEAIIEPELWDQVQNMIAKKATSYGSHPEGMFARKVRCFYCGSRMHSVKNGNKRGLKCDRHAISHEYCVGAYISLPKLERIVAAQLQILSDELLDTELLEEKIDLYPDLREMRATIEAKRENYKKKIEASNTGMRNLYIDKVKRVISETDYLAFVEELRRDIAQCEYRIAECDDHISQIDKTLGQDHNKRMMVEQYVGTRHLTKEMVDVLVDHILVGRRDPITKETPVEIHWNF